MQVVFARRADDKRPLLLENAFSRHQLWPKLSGQRGTESRCAEFCDRAPLKLGSFAPA
jgi:hypothetical protein